MQFGIQRDRLTMVFGILVLFATGVVVVSMGAISGPALVWAADEKTPTPAKTDVEATGAPPTDEKTTNEKSSADVSEDTADEKTPDKKGAADAKEGVTEKGAENKTVKEKKTSLEEKDEEIGDVGKIDEKMDVAERDAGERGGAAGGPGPKESFLTWLSRSLGARYIIIFLIITFNAVALIVMILLGIRRSIICPDEFVNEFEAKLNEKKYQEAYELAKANRSFLGKVLAAGMSRLSDGYEESLRVMQEVGEEQNMKLEQRNGYIALIAQIGPMFGLLGTVDGMVMAFDVIAHSNVTPKPSELAQGIGTALVTTVVGLWIAIPTLVFYHIIHNRLSRLVGEVGAVSGNLMKRFANVQIASKKIEK